MSDRQYKIGDASELHHVPPKGGVPSSATLTIYDETNTELLGTTAATIDAYSGVVSSAPRGGTTITVDDSTGIVLGQSYWLATDGGRGIQVVAIDKTATTVEVSDPIKFAVTSGTLKGQLITYSLASTVVTTTKRRCSIRWTYTVDGAEITKREMTDFVLEPFLLELDERSLRETESLWTDQRSPGGSTSALKEQGETAIFNWLLGEQVYPDLVRDSRQLEQALIYHVLMMRHVRQEELFLRFQMLHTEELAKFKTSKCWYDHDDDMAVARGTLGTSAGYGQAEDELSGPPIKRIPVG